MKLLLTANSYWMKQDLDCFAEQWDKDLIDGVEVCVNINTDNFEHIKKLAQNCYKNNWIFQIHSNELYDEPNSKLHKTLFMYNEIAHEVKGRIILTLHPAPKENEWYFHKIKSCIENNHLHLIPVIENIACLQMKTKSI